MAELVRDRLARLAHSVRYEDLAPEVVQETKRIVLDTLACALGGHHSEPAAIVRRVAQSLGGTAQATTIGDGGATSCALATLVNGTLIRYLDGNDYHFGKDSAHPSGNLAPALAVAEMAGRGGRDVIAALVMAYEIQMRLCDLVAPPGISGRGWHPGTHMQFSAAALAARLLADDPKVTANALSLAGTHNNTLAQLQRGHIPAAKATAEAWVAKGAVEAALLAQAGLTGPEEIFEGVAGWGRTVAGEVDFAALTAPFAGRYRILESCLKPYAAVAGAMAPIQCALELVRSGRVTVGEIDSIVVKLHAHAAKKAAADPKKLHPRDKETADHSYHYCVAVSLLDGACGEAQFTQARITAPDVADLIGRTRIEADDALTALYPASSGGGVVVRMRDGREIAKVLEYPPGHPRNRLSDADVERKLFDAADGVLSRSRAQRLIDSVSHLEKIDRVGELMALTVADTRGGS
jgi:2-methylcitrate dehydratase